MTTTKVLRTPVDTWCGELVPGATKVYAHILRVSGTSSQRKRAFIFFPNLILDSKFTVTDATLYLYAAKNFTGTPTILVDRVTSKWKAQRTTWNNQPTVSTTHEASAVGTGVLDGGVMTFNLTAMMNDVAAGNPNYGLRISTGATTADWDFHSAQSIKPGKKPRLVITYARTPNAPTDLRPSGNLAIGSNQPALAWSTEVNQVEFQVQISSDNTAFVANIVHDSSNIADERSLYRLDETAFSLPGGSALRYWRVRVKNAIGVWSDWSDIVGMYYLAHGTLNITNPSSGSAFVEETTPPIDWTFTGATKKAYKVDLYDLGMVDPATGLFAGWGDDWGESYGAQTWRHIWGTGWQNSTETRVTVPPHKIKRLDNSYYMVEVRVRDDQDRTSSPGTPVYVLAQRVFSFREVATVSAVSTLTVTNPEGWYVQLDWTDAVQPDYYGIKVDGEYVKDRETPTKYFVSGTSYRKKFYNTRPFRLSEYEVVRIVKDGANVYKHSQHSANPHPTYRFIPVGVWLVDPDTDSAVNIGVGGDDVSVDLRIGESTTVYYPIGRRDPVRVVDAVRGLEGTITGKIRGLDAKERFEYFKSNIPTKEFQLITGDLSIPVHLGEVTSFYPTNNPLRGASPSPSDKLWSVTVEVFQSDDWTFAARY